MSNVWAPLMISWAPPKGLGKSLALPSALSLRLWLALLYCCWCSCWPSHGISKTAWGSCCSWAALSPQPPQGRLQGLQPYHTKLHVLSVTTPHLQNQNHLGEPYTTKVGCYFWNTACLCWPWRNTSHKTLLQRCCSLNYSWLFSPSWPTSTVLAKQSDSGLLLITVILQLQLTSHRRCFRQMVC